MYTLAQAVQSLDTLHLILVIISTALGIVAVLIRAKHAQVSSLLDATVKGIEIAGRQGDAKAAVEAVATESGVQKQLDSIVQTLFPKEAGK